MVRLFSWVSFFVVVRANTLAPAMPVSGKGVGCTILAVDFYWIESEMN